MSSTATQKVLQPLQPTIDRLTQDFASIPVERKARVKELTDFVEKQRKNGRKVLLNFICTHNSRRSHISQIWAQTASHYYGIEDVETFSGGTEATAFNPKAVKAMQDAGFEITMKEEGTNPVYEVRFASDAAALTIFSKKYDDTFNPTKDFAAVMTCSHADENCPIVFGAIERIALTYDDPKEFDGTPLELAKYAERVQEIGRELLYGFSQVK
jgi:arsenate reductase (thioredoxin)